MGKFEFTWWQIAYIIVIGPFCLIRYTVIPAITRSSFWRFCRTYFGPLEGLNAGSILRLRPLPQSRRRALTLPLPEPSIAPSLSELPCFVANQPRTAGQRLSGLLTKLLEDVRLIIYEAVLGEMGFHLSVAQMRSPLQCFICCHSNLLFGPDTHGVCHVKKKKDLLPLLLTCRQIYSEAIHILYAANAFQFSQPFGLRSFVNMLPMHRLSSIRRLRFYLHLERHPTLNARTRGDWEDIWTFFSRTLSGPTLLRVDLGMDRAVVRRIANENEDDAGWLLPVAQCVRSAWHEGVHGNGQAIQHRTIFVRIPHSDEQWTCECE